MDKLYIGFGRPIRIEKVAAYEQKVGAATQGELDYVAESSAQIVAPELAFFAKLLKFPAKMYVCRMDKFQLGSTDLKNGERANAIILQ